mmetsp:Transcript_28902/g.39921  ORF Transcript_28902/g.39921 Transcript_28902/m.39921 type:complete len:211 (-) Transcript_28902:333-965(-)
MGLLCDGLLSAKPRETGVVRSPKEFTCECWLKEVFLSSFSKMSSFKVTRVERVLLSSRMSGASTLVWEMDLTETRPRVVALGSGASTLISSHPEPSSFFFTLLARIAAARLLPDPGLGGGGGGGGGGAPECTVGVEKREAGRRVERMGEVKLWEALRALEGEGAAREAILRSCLTGTGRPVGSEGRVIWPRSASPFPLLFEEMTLLVLER